MHVTFGNVLGDDRKMLKSRSGDPVTFIELHRRGHHAGAAAVPSSEPEAARRRAVQLGHDIGIGALKYAS